MFYYALPPKYPGQAEQTPYFLLRLPSGLPQQ